MATRVDVVVDMSSPDKLSATVMRRGGDVDTSMKDRAEGIAKRARDLAPSRTGALRRSIRVAQPRDRLGRFQVGWEVSANTPYAKFVHEGTRPHEIRGRPLLAFHWAKVGKFMVLPRVNHPGTDPQRFLTNALRGA